LRKRRSRTRLGWLGQFCRLKNYIQPIKAFADSHARARLQPKRQQHVIVALLNVRARKSASGDLSR
jgi:hypothetical protein